MSPCLTRIKEEGEEKETVSKEIDEQTWRLL